MINEIGFNSKIESSFQEQKVKKSDSKNDFKNFLELRDYESILEKTLSYLSDLEKESHLKTLKVLEEQGYSKEEITTINLYLISKEEDFSEKLNLSNEDKKLLGTYNNVFEKIKEAIKEKREERFALKPLQAEIFRSDTLLKTKDIIEGKQPQEYSLNLEV